MGLLEIGILFYFFMHIDIKSKYKGENKSGNFIIMQNYQLDP